MSCKGHTSARPGKRVLVLMRDGEHFVAKLKKVTDLSLSFEDHEKVSVKAIRSVVPYKADRYIEKASR